MVDAPERAVVVPAAKVAIDRAARGQVLGERGPLTACAQDIHHAVDHLSHIHGPLVAATLGRRDQRGNQRPFRVGYITRIAQRAAVVAGTVLSRPHAKSIAAQPPTRKSQAIQMAQFVRRWTLSALCAAAGFSATKSICPGRVRLFLTIDAMCGRSAALSCLLIASTLSFDSGTTARSRHGMSAW